jgi:hypothetical protein
MRCFLSPRGVTASVAALKAMMLIDLVSLPFCRIALGAWLVLDFVGVSNSNFYCVGFLRHKTVQSFFSHMPVNSCYPPQKKEEEPEKHEQHDKHERTT